MSTRIPQPPTLPVIGNLLDIDPNNFLRSFEKLADKYGEIYKVKILSNESYIVNSVDLAEELCDERRFGKKIDEVLQEARHAAGDGLFTAHSHEPAWAAAHRTLMPAFGPIAINEMYDEMSDIASQLVSKWARNGPEYAINVSEDMTRLTLDSIALCAMDMRFNSFYKEEMHPMVTAMVGVMTEIAPRSQRSKIQALLNPKAEKKFWKNISVLQETAQACIEQRRANPGGKKDLLEAMLNGKDPATGQKLPDHTVMNNMITMLIAGHETTSGLLSFAIYYLLKNPGSLQKAQQEVDRTIGKGQVRYKHLSKLPFLEAVLRETLRLNPTAPFITVSPQPGTKDPVVLGGGKYVIPADANVTLLLSKIHRDPSVYGEDANEFKPERMMDEKFRQLRSGAWKPFGNGSRACIGRPFAWQESVLALTLILQNFDIRLADPNYELRIVTTLTIKPGGLFIKARLRNDINPISLLKNLHGGSGVTTNHSVTKQARSETPTLDPTIGEPVTILFGSSSGTSEGLAQTLAASARRRGLKPIVQSLDAAVDNVPINQPVIIIGCTYEGQPPDNAKIFCEWIKNADPAKLSSVRFALFGCGHKGWASTYQRIPRLISEQLVAKGATMLVECGETDVSQGTISDDFDSWTETLWPTICANPTHDDSSEALDLTLSTTSRASHLHYSIREAQVLTNDRITHPDTAEKRHISLQLPPDMTYEVGDYLAVLPLNSAKTVARVLRRFALPWDTMMTLSPNSTHATIPTAHELPVATVLAGYVELSRPATRKHKSTLARYAGGALTTDARGDSCIDILERHPTIPIPFATFLAMLPPLRLRQYSISSSPRASSSSLATITFSVIGAATTYLKTLDPGSTVQVTIQKSPAHFRLPASDDDDTAPLILVATGTGLAPFRAFLQDRALRRAAAGHRPVGPAAAALLFIGCRHPDHDRLFGDDLARWEASGLVRVFPAYSRAPERAEGCRYVQDRLWRERDLVAREFDRGARAYVCGGSAVGKAVTDVAVRILRAKSEEVGKPMTADEAERCWEAWRGERYAVDVFD